MNSNNCGKKIGNAIGIYTLILLLIGLIFLLPFLTKYKINPKFLKYIGLSLLTIFIIYSIVITIIFITTKKSCDIQKNIISRTTFGLKNCFTNNDCTVHQKCSSFLCKNKNVENEKCEYNDDCVNNLWCNKEKCVPKRRIGDICCNDEMCLSQKCGDDNRCINSINSIGDINDSCRTSNDCMFNLWCDQNKCSNKKNDGNKCNNDDNCISGKCSSELYCLAKEDDKYYIPNNRGPCSSDSDCLNESVCDESVCKARVNIVENKKNCKK